MAKKVQAKAMTGKRCRKRMAKGSSRINQGCPGISLIFCIKTFGILAINVKDLVRLD